MTAPLPESADLRVFVAVVRKGSFAAAAESLGASAAYASKRLQILEANLGTKLLHRSTRRVVLTEEGERVFQWAQRVLDDLKCLRDEVSERSEEPQGPLRICSSFGFGRRIVAPLFSRLVARHPGLTVRFEMFDRLVDITSEGFDLDVRVGDDIAPQFIAKRLADNHRVLCASPSYLDEHGTPQTLDDLAHHNCLVTKERDHPFGIWRLKNKGHTASVKVTGNLSSNQGEVVLQWCEQGRGIALRSLWDVGPLLRAGHLRVVLPEWTQEANIWAVYPSRLSVSPRVRICVDFLEKELSGDLFPLAN